MKESKLLKAISYLLIPILIAVIILSYIYEVQKSEFANVNGDNYFSTEVFVSNYIYGLKAYAEELIYRNSYHSSIKDGNFEIFFEEEENTYNSNIVDDYFLIIYKNKAFTNVELTSETNTIIKIKNYINENENSKKLSIINGKVESDSSIISSKGIKYLTEFEGRYYSNDDMEYGYNYYSIEDFEIYSSYKENLKLDSFELIFINLLYKIVAYENYIYIGTPVCIVLLILLILYLLISIGHSKGKKGITLNDFDKIPFELIIFLAGLFLTFAVIPYSIYMDNYNYHRFNFLISAILTAYFVTYIVCAIVINTTIKRIKARKFIENTFLYKVINFIHKRLKIIFKEFDNSISFVWKLIAFLVTCVLIIIILCGIFGGFGVLLSLVFCIFIFYKILQRINCLKKIEEHLKKMYNGSCDTKLEGSDFTKEFENVVTYINDISNGFEAAVQEGVKSERLKTELITNVSHDIKTPLTSIINYIDLLKQENIENENVKEYIEVLESKSQRLKKLTEDLVEASKASSGNIKLNIEKINVEELINQSIGEFEDKFNEKKLELITNISSRNICINADSRYMYRVIENLFGNITKYALENSRVYIDINMTIDGKVIIDIKNISNEKLNISEEELMQRFVRGDKSRTTEGSGLGLSISKSLTEVQNGEFNLKIDGDLFKVQLIFDIVI